MAVHRSSSSARSRKFRGAASLLLLCWSLSPPRCAWEFYCRSIGYGPTLNDNEDLWTLARRRVRTRVGRHHRRFARLVRSRSRRTAKRFRQTPGATCDGPGSCAYPVLADLANDQTFHGIIICSFVPAHIHGPTRAHPPMERGEKNVRRSHTQTPAQRVSQYLAMPLEEHVAFLKAADLTLEDLLKRLPIPNRPDALVPPPPPPYFQTIDRERRARMIEECARPGSELQRRIQQGWIPLFTPPPPPSYIPKEVFMAQMKNAIEQRFRDTVAAAAQKLRARGGKVVFVRLPVSGGAQRFEDRTTPRSQTWDPVTARHRRSRYLLRRFSRASGLQLPRVVALVRR